MSKRQQMEIEVRKLLFDIPLSERIQIIERIGKQYRQQNSREIAKEVDEFKRKQGLLKQIDHYSILD